MNFTNIDNPIIESSSDLLGFAPLAKKIANSIINSNIETSNSFTISIEGNWGSGKTSLVNLIRNEIKDEVIILRFNPWMINDFEQLIKYFFSEFIKIIMKEIPWHKPYLKSKVIKSIKKMASFLTPDSVRVGNKDFSTTYKTKDILFSEKTIYELKEEINTHLKKLNKQIVIIVDDIDRLTDKETETFFRLIKGIADFDNLIYLLLYDKVIVSKSLEQFKQENGEKYLDKIVQYSISIPKIYNTTLNKILFDKLDIILEETNYNFNQEKWNEIIPLLDNYIANIRDINKIVSTISFEYPQISEEVEFTDFFIISLIKVQKYELYELIRDKVYIFGNDKYNVWEIRKDDDKENELEVEKKEFLENFFSKFLKYKPLFYKLFPTLKDEEYYRWNRLAIHKYKPIDNEHYFENYFTFSVADNKISSQEYNKLSKKLFLDNFQEFEDAIVAINNIERVLLFLEMFRSIKESKAVKNIDNAKNIIINLLTIREKLPTPNSWLSSPAMTYFNTAKEIFEKIKKSEVILEAIYIEPNTISLNTKLLFYREIKKIYDYETRFDEKIINKIEKKLSHAIESIKLFDLVEEKKSLNIISSIYTLISSYKLLSISTDNLLNDIDEVIFQSRTDFFNILGLFKSEISVNNGKPFPHISAENISEYTNLDIKKIEKYMSELDEKTFTKKELEIVKAWKSRNEY